MDNITHSGNTIRTVPSPFDRAGFDLALIKLEQRIASLESDADRINCNANVANDRIDALIDRIDKLEAENAALRDELRKSRLSGTLADRILDYFLNDSARSVRSSELRKRFGVISASQMSQAMQIAAKRSNGKIIFTKFSSRFGDENTLLKI